MQSCLSLRTRDLKLLLDDDAGIATVVVMRASRTSNHRVHRYGVSSLAVDLLRRRALRFQRDIPQVLPEFTQLLKPARRVFGRVGDAGFVGDGIVRVGGAVLLPGLEDLRNDNG